MINKLKSVRDRFSEKTKLIIYVSTAVLVFIVCSLVPLAFRGDIITDGIFDTGERASMFAKYLDSDKSVKVRVNDKPDKAELKYCEKLFENIYDFCIVDNAEGKIITQDHQFLSLSDGENIMNVCRMWIQDQGDWTNWLDVYMDVDTGFIYYLYVSSICLSNGGQYYDAFPAELNARQIADFIASETGFELKLLNWSGNAEDTAAAYTAMDGEAIIWEINCSSYPSSMLDVKICVA